MGGCGAGGKKKDNREQIKERSDKYQVTMYKITSEDMNAFYIVMPDPRPCGAGCGGIQ